ncbi:tetratricopeptide repeat protein, partial [candidate division KSB1 bacterium]|nr:tetratricopeptide repeat protein [candidate division KSB1 bacterium]
RLFEPSAQLGLSYLIPSLDVLFNSGYHINKGKNTNHLGLGFELNQNVRIFSGLEELDFDKWGVGMGYTHDNFIFGFSYSAELTRILFSLTARISPAPEVLASPYYENAFENFNSKNYKTASHQFRKYLSFDLRNSRSDTARHLVRFLEKKLARDQMMVDSLLTVTSKLLTQGEKQYLRAALILSKILELDPDNLKARSKLATLSAHVDKFVKKSLADGIFEFQGGKYFEAKQSFNRVLLFDKENRAAQNYLSRIDKILKDLGEEYFYRGVGYFRQKNYVRAKEEFLRALKYNPDLGEAKSYLDRTARKLRETNQKIADLIQQGQELEKKKEYVDATNKYLAVLKLDKSNSFVKSRIKVLRPKVNRYIQNEYNRGLKHYRNEAYLEAQEAFSTVLSIDPNHTAARTRLRDLRQEKKAKASSYLKQADLAFRKRQWQTALEMYSKVINLNPGSSLAVERIAEIEQKKHIDDLLKKARAHFSSQDYKEAVEVYETVLQLDPNNQIAKAELDSTQNTIDDLVEKYFNDGINLYTLDRYQEAIEMWNKALALKPDHESSLAYKQQALERIEALKKMK